MIFKYHRPIAYKGITETERTLLRALRPQARRLPLQRRRVVLHRLHGEVHVGLEHRVEDVCRPDTEGEPAGRGGFAELFLDGEESSMMTMD